MGTIKLKRGTGSPAGSLEQYEVAMDVADKKLYTSTNGTDAVILANKYDDADADARVDLQTGANLDLSSKSTSDLSEGTNEYFTDARAITAIEDASSLDLSGKIETSSGLTNETQTYNNRIQATRINNSLNTQLTAVEITRDLGSDGAVSGFEERAASIDFSIQSDATNTNNAPQNIYAGGFMGGSGSNDASEPHWIAGFTYDASDPSNKYTIFEGNNNDLTINPRIRANDGMDIEDPDAELDDAVLNIKVDDTGYNRPQILCEDSNGKVFSMIGEMDDVNQNRDKFIVTLDPENIHSPNNITSFAGDYGIYYLKEYNDINNPGMEMNVFGAKDGFKLRIYDDANSSDNGASGSPSPGPLGNYGGYGFKPFEAHCENFQVHAKISDTDTDKALEIDSTDARFEVPIMPPRLTATERNSLAAAEGMIIYNMDDTRVEYYDGSDWRYITGTIV